MTDDETPIGTAEAARLLGICARKAQALIRSKKLDDWAIETPGGHVHAWRATRAAVEAYKRGGRRELAVARAGKPSWLAAS